MPVHRSGAGGVMTTDRQTSGAGGGGVELASLTSIDLLLSILAPVGWDLEPAEGMLRMIGPEADGHRPTFTIRAGVPQEQGEAWFAAFREGAVARMPSAVPGFVELGRSDFVLSSFVDVTAVCYRRDDPSGLQVSQLQAYLWADSYRMYVVDAATARSREAADLPLFDRILRSLRLLPQP